MPDIDLISESQKPLADAQADEESKDLVSRSKRNRREQNAMHWAFVSVLWIIVVGFGLAILTIVLHMILPDHYCWLNQDHITKLNQFVTTGGIGGVGATLLKNKVGASPSK